MRALPLGLAALLAASPALAQPAAQPACPAARPGLVETRPTELAEPNWRSRVQLLTEELRGVPLDQVKLVFLGDSLVQGWFPEIWRQFYGHRGVLNLGVNGDFTQGLLWRIANGHWPAGLRPQGAVVLIGTNNTLYNGSAENVAAGVMETVRAIRARSPRTRVLVLGLLPRGADARDPSRAVHARINQILARCADGRDVFFFDAGSVLTDASGNLSEHVAWDRIHLTFVGYALLSAAIEPSIRRLLPP
ncbi:MAG: GDSL family lipase [Acetobacteraceae bacterium]|nr:GDSL family lipase [Acetobacteraceae bacterium]